MAIIDVIGTGVIANQPFKTAPGDVIDQTFLPEGLTWFSFQAAVPAKIATNETHIRITMTLPNQYTYILKEFHVDIQLTLGLTHNFSEFGLLRVQNGYPGSVVNRFQTLQLKNEGIAGEFGTSVATDPVRAYDLVTPFRQLLQPPEDQSVVLVIELADEDAGATNVGVITMTANFYRYNIEQALSSALNAPQPVISF